MWLFTSGNQRALKQWGYHPEAVGLSREVIYKSTIMGPTATTNLHPTHALPALPLAARHGVTWTCSTKPSKRRGESATRAIFFLDTQLYIHFLMGGVDTPSSHQEAEAALRTASCVVNFCASWCEPCEHMNNVFAELAGEVRGLKLLQVPLPAA